MTDKPVHAFWEKARTDAKLRKLLAPIAKTAASEDAVTRVVSVAQAAGFRFTADEFRQELARRTRELDPEELDSVAGGSIIECEPQVLRRPGMPTPNQIIAILIGL